MQALGRGGVVGSELRLGDSERALVLLLPGLSVVAAT